MHMCAKTCPLHLCSWEVQKIIKIPKSAAFEDYSDLAFAPGKRGGGIKNQLAITSQVSSVRWQSVHTNNACPVLRRQSPIAHNCTPLIAGEQCSLDR